MIHALNEKCAVIAEESRAGDEDLDQRISELAAGLNGLGRGGKATDITGITENVDDLRSRLRILFENDANQ